MIFASAASAVTAEEPKRLLLHLNGIGGHRRIDDRMTQGLVEGGFKAEVIIEDWTGDDTGLVSLSKTALHEEYSTRVAKMIEERLRIEPELRITLTGHSAGAGIACWALEKLPDDVIVDDLLMIQPALSPGFDLSKALSRVRRKAYALTSVHDVIVLSAGTRMFGTVDRVKSDAAGLVGFAIPENADKQQYAKLVQLPYRSEWMRYANIGDHIGPMSFRFARDVIAPMMLTGVVPPPATQPSTRPSTAPSTAPKPQATSQPR